jgi:hypothetical protein
MKKLEWEYLTTDMEWNVYEAVTGIGTYIMYANEGNGVYEVEFVPTNGEWEDVYGMYDIYDARQAAQDHYNAKVEGTT